MNTAKLDSREHINPATSRASDGISKEAASILAVTPAANGHSDTSSGIANTSPTAPPAWTSRRKLLMNTIVSVASLASATAMDLPSAGQSVSSDADPIFAAIARHESAVEDNAKAISNHSRLEEELPADRRRSSITVDSRNIIETDDPRWINVQEQVDRTYDAMYDAAMTILAIEPKTIEGACALLQYMIDHMDRNQGMTIGWPDSLLPDSIDPDMAKWSDYRSSEYFLMQNLACSLERLSIAAG